MKFFGLHLVLLLGTFLGPVAAYGPRAAAEQTSYWYIYLLEGMVGKNGDTRTVAPGCAEHYGLGKDEECDLKQFLKYLWYPRIGKGQFAKDPANPSEGTEEKEVYSIGGDPLLKENGQPMSLDEALNRRPDYPVGNPINKQPWQAVPIARVYNTILQAKWYDGTDPDRMVRGESDYWEARRKITRALPAIAAQYPWDDSNTNKKYIKMAKMVRQAQSAVQSAYLVRLQDYERYRLTNNWLKQKVQSKVGKEVEIKTNVIDSGMGFQFETLNAQGTLDANPNVDGLEDKLQESCVEARTESKEHWDALQAAIGAVQEGQCAMPQGITLR